MGPVNHSTTKQFLFRMAVLSGARSDTCSKIHFLM